ncbi:MAG: helix-turn-helix domain-containing protein [Actinomycetota bacterium]
MAIEDDAERQAARELGQQIRRLRERKGWTAKALGHKAGDYDRSTISCIEIASNVGIGGLQDLLPPDVRHLDFGQI